MPRDIFTEDPDDFDDGDEAIEVGGDAPPARQSSGPSAGPVSLRAQWDQQGRCWVAQFQGGEQIEKWRTPTKEEWDALRDRGTLTRAAGGNPLAPAGTPPVSGLAGLLDTAKKNAVPVGVGVALAAASWYAWSAWKSSKRKVTDVDVDEGGSVEDEDSGEDVGEE